MLLNMGQRTIENAYAEYERESKAERERGAEREAESMRRRV